MQLRDALSVFEPEVSAIIAKALCLGQRFALYSAYQHKIVPIIREITAIYCWNRNCRVKPLRRYRPCDPDVSQQRRAIPGFKEIILSDLPHIVCRFCSVYYLYVVNGQILRDIPI